MEPKPAALRWVQILGPALSALMLTWTLASRNLFLDRLRFAATTIGVVFSVVLIMVQLGLYVGFGQVVTTMIDHAAADLWVVAKGTKSFEDLTPLESNVQSRVKEVEGVATVVPVMIGFSEWRLPDGAMTPVFVVGSDLKPGDLIPWNIVQGTLHDLEGRDAIAIDRFYFDRLGVSRLGEKFEIGHQPARVAAVTEGIRSFTTTPYVFTDMERARRYTRMPPNLMSHFMVRLRPGADRDATQKTIESKVAGVEVLTPEQFSRQSRSFWLFGTGAGAALLGGAILGFIVGAVIVAQTLYSSTMDHLIEFATLRAMGSSRLYIYRVIIIQACLSAFIGFVVAGTVFIIVVFCTRETALPIVMTPLWALGILALTIAMCVGAATTAIVRVVRIDPVVAFSQ
jgi:putative ABC transport system permease protein